MHTHVAYICLQLMNYGENIAGMHAHMYIRLELIKHGENRAGMHTCMYMRVRLELLKEDITVSPL